MLSICARSARGNTKLAMRELTTFSCISAALLLVLAASTDARILEKDIPPLVLINAKTGVIKANYPEKSCIPNAAVGDGRRGWFLGGYSASGPCVVRLDRDGYIDKTFTISPKLKDYRYPGLMIRAENTLIIGGEWGVAAFNERSGRRLWLKGTDGQVNGLAFGLNTLYVSGAFKRIGGIDRRCLTAIKPRTGEITTWKVNIATNGLGPIAYGRGRIYIGSGAYRIDGQKRRYGLGAVNAKTGKLVKWTPRPRPGDGAVGETLVVSHGQVIVGGREAFGSFSAATGQALDWTDRLKGTASRLSLSQDVLYLGAGEVHAGFFDRVDEKRVNNLAAVNLRNKRFLDWRPIIAECVNVTAISASGDQVLVSGEFGESTAGCGPNG